jgi:acyl-CoA hydrolase/GNAT superfamily N-acetyltransferase
MSSLRALKEKLTTPEAAVSAIRSGARVYVGNACATPRVLTRALEDSPNPPSDVQFLHFLTSGATSDREDGRTTLFQHRCFFVGSDMRELVKQGKAQYVPISIAQVLWLIDNGRIVVDAALIQVSAPDEHGYVSLGVSVDITHAMLRKARTIIAEINPQMPFTLGDSFVPLNEIDSCVLVDAPVIEFSHEPSDEVARQIARYVARTIDDGATLQIGLGRIPNEMLKYLTGRRDLGIHSDVITDGVIDLIEAGVITGKAKGLHRGQVVTSYCMGTRRLYDFIDRNPLFSFQPISYVCNPAVIAAHDRFVSVTQAFAVDLTGQVCSDQFQGEFYGGVSTQPDFLRAAAASHGGKPIICLPSTTVDGKISRIRPLLLEGEGATIPRSDVHYVVTEYGSAYLFGKSIQERALTLVEIAHPSFRPWLLEEAKRLGYVRPDQGLRTRRAYPVEEEREAVLKDGRKVSIRPSRASDVRALQDLFYTMNREDVYTRFFQRLEALAVPEAEHLCNVDYENEMAFLAVIGERENEKVVGSSCYFLNPSTNLAEVGFMIRSDWQGTGLGTALQRRMTEYAKTRGLRGFTAEILTSNNKMLRLARSASDNVTMKGSYGVYEVTMLF